MPSAVPHSALQPNDFVLVDRRGARRRPTTVLFDGDDTLWMTEPLYDAARDRAAAIVAAAGLDAACWTRLQHEIDHRNVGRHGLSKDRFPTSSVEALDQLARDEGRTIDDRVTAAVRAAAASVFDAIAPLAVGAAGALDALARVARCVLLTQGDPTVQAKRLADSGLERRFDAAVVVAKKDRACYGRIAAWLGVPTSTCWMVGNSVPSDVNPSIAAGMHAVWVDAYVWRHERREDLHADSSAVAASGLDEAAQLILGRVGP